MDYLITNERLLNQLLYFKVSDFLPLHSDCHCKSSWEILAKFNFNNSKSRCTDLRSARRLYIDQSILYLFHLIRHHDFFVT
jgi:hypothetical protein